MRLERVQYSKCNPRVKSRLRELTLLGAEDQWGSSMDQILDELDSGWRKDREVPIILAYVGRKIVGWGLIADPGYTRGKPILMIYVEKAYRRQGIGRAIGQRLKRFKNGRWCFPWSPEAKLFYFSLKVPAFANRSNLYG